VRSRSTMLGLCCSVALWFVTSPYIFAAAIRVIADEGVFVHKFLVVACYGALLFVAGLASYLYANYRRNSPSTLFSFNVTSLFVHASYSGFHLLTALALFTPYMNLARYLVLLQVDSVFTVLLSSLFLRRKVGTQHFLCAILSIVSIALFFLVTITPVAKSRFLGKVSIDFPNWSEMKGVFYAVAARLCYVLRGTLSKGLILQQGMFSHGIFSCIRKHSFVAPLTNGNQPSGQEVLDAAEADADAEEQALKSNKNNCCGQSTCMRIPPPPGLHEGRVEQVFSSMLYDSTYIGRTFAQTMELHSVGGALVLVPCALLAAFIDGETGAGGYAEMRSVLTMTSDPSMTTFLFIFLVVAFFLQPFSMPKLVFSTGVQSYTTLHTLTAILIILWSSEVYQPLAAIGIDAALLSTNSTNITNILGTNVTNVTGVISAGTGIDTNATSMASTIATAVLTTPTTATTTTSIGVMQVLAILLFAINSQWFMYASTRKASKVTAAQNIARVIAFFELDPDPVEAQQFTVKMKAIDRQLGRPSFNRVLLGVVTTSDPRDPGTSLRSVIRKIPSLVDSTGARYDYDYDCNSSSGSGGSGFGGSSSSSGSEFGSGGGGGKFSDSLSITAADVEAEVSSSVVDSETNIRVSTKKGKAAKRSPQKRMPSPKRAKSPVPETNANSKSQFQVEEEGEGDQTAKVIVPAACTSKIARGKGSPANAKTPSKSQDDPSKYNLKSASKGPPNRITLAPLQRKQAGFASNSNNQAESSDDEESDDGGDGAFF